MHMLSKGWWAGLGVILAAILGIAGIAVTIAVAQQPETREPRAEASAPASSKPSESPLPVDNSATETPRPSPTVATPTLLYLMNLDDDAIVQDPHWVWDHRGAVSVAGVTYANSLSYQFQNCSRCTESLEFVVPAGYDRLTGVFGLSDTSRHDDVIDGVVYFTIYDAAGNQLTQPQRIEYPEAIPVDVNIEGQPRIRIEMSEGTNNEEFVLGDAALVRSNP